MEPFFKNPHRNEPGHAGSFVATKFPEDPKKIHEFAKTGFNPKGCQDFLCACLYLRISEFIEPCRWHYSLRELCFAAKGSNPTFAPAKS